MGDTAITDKQLQEAKRYAICIIGESYKFRDFAINMIDYMGPEICLYLRELYKGLSQLLFSRALRQDDIDEIDRLSDDEIMWWYAKYKDEQKDWEERLQEQFKENIDELQFLVQSFREKEEFQKMLDFVGKFSHIAPYNAMLVEMQKPGATLVLKGRDWQRYNRILKPNAQKLITLKQFGPIQCYFDLSDTEPMPDRPLTGEAEILDRWNKSLKRTRGKIDEGLYHQLVNNLMSYGIYLDDSFNASNTYGGYVMEYDHRIGIPVNRSLSLEYNSRFLISVNRTQTMTEKFHTICHELGHIFCRHQSYNPTKKRRLTVKEKEFEAETVAWLVCKRHGVDNPSEEYLATYAPEGIIPVCSTDYILKAVTEIEKMLSKNVYVRQSLWYKEDKPFQTTLDAILRKMKDGKPKKKERVF